MEITTLNSANIAEITAVFNAAFSDYVLPLTLSPTDLAAKMASENVMAEWSAGAFADGKLVGFILMGTDGKTAYNAGTGVIAEFRGQKLTAKMYDFLLPMLAEKNIVNHQLEVITQNAKAIPIYEKIGFITTRKVVCFKGKITNCNHGSAELKPVGFADVTPLETSWDFSPTYQNASHAIARTPELHQTIGAYRDGKLLGYVVFGKANLRVKQFVVEKEFRRQGIGQQLFSEVQRMSPDKDVSLINIDSTDGSIDFLKKIGLAETVSQFEMRLQYGA